MEGRTRHPTPTTDFTGCAVIVTGGAQGIGRAIVEAFAARGANLVIGDRNGQGALALAETLRADGKQAVAVPCDLAHQAECDRLVGQTLAAFGRVDVVIHNAGYFPLTPFEDITEEILGTTLSVNLAACFWLCQAALPHFKARSKGRFLVTSSTTGPRVVYPGLAHYAASKAGVNGFIRAAALELAQYGVTVNGVEPGMIATPAMDNLGDSTHVEALRKTIPLGRLGAPPDIAAAMAFLASDSAGYITGQTIVVDGGATLPETGCLSQPQP